jgi:predicted Zn finger-like uncharacterized protein
MGEPRVSDSGTEPRITECPGCQTQFRVSSAQLGAAGGKVRCGACRTVFNAAEHFVTDRPPPFGTPYDAQRALDELLAELRSETRVVPVSRHAPADTAPDGTVIPDAAPGDAPEPEPAAPAAPEAEDDVHAAGTPEPAEAAEAAAAEMPAAAPAAGWRSWPGDWRRKASAEPEPAPLFAPPPRRLWIWPALGLLVLVLAGQFLWLRFDELARDPGWRPLYARLCGVFRCELPVLRDLERLRTRNLVVRSHPDDGGRLLVQAMLVNEAEHPQPFPVLELRFSAANGVLVAGHRFQPAEYLAGDALGLAQMPARTPVQIALEVPDPGEEAVNYQLRLR